MGDTLRFVGVVLTFLPTMASIFFVQKVKAIIHRWSYKGPSDTPRTVVVVGGSFSGVQLALRLADSLPTGWQVVLVERNSHFNYSFNLPRLSVVPGYDRSVFIPYDGIFGKALPGILKHVQGDAVEVAGNKKEVTLASGEVLPYDILVVSTGSAQRPPAKLLGAADRDMACAELRELQGRIRRAHRVAVVGGGAVGVEIATDIKTFVEAGTGKETASKNVTLVHSRDQLLTRFGPRLHEHVVGVLAKLGINVVLGQRPTVVYADSTPDAQVGGAGALHYADGRVEEYDCILMCTGQTPNSGLLKTAYADTILDSGEIRVTPALQVADAQGQAVPDMYAFGDVAATGGAKMARAGYFQANTVAANVVANAVAITQGTPTAVAATVYKPGLIEPSIRLTLGENDSVTYMDKPGGQSILLSHGGESVEAQIKRAWFFFGLKYKKE